MNWELYTIGLGLVVTGCLIAIPLLHEWIDYDKKWARIPLVLCGAQVITGAVMVGVA